MNKTKIDTWDSVWNVVTGCPFGCKWCYARSFAERMRHNPNKKVAEKYRNGFDPTYHPGELYDPMFLKKPQNIFVASMGDIFDPEITDSQRQNIFGVIRASQKHQFFILTKRSMIMKKFITAHLNNSISNLWVGVSATSQAELNARLVDLLQLKKSGFIKKVFISMEPIVQSMELEKAILFANPQMLTKIDKLLEEQDKEYILPDWIIMGPMTGRKVEYDIDIVKRNIEFCSQNRIPFFWKGKEDLPKQLP